MVNSLFRFSFHLWNTYFIWYLMFLNALEIKVFVKKKIFPCCICTKCETFLFLFFYNSHSRTGVKYLNCLNTCSNKLLNITRYICYVKNGVWPFFYGIEKLKAAHYQNGVIILAFFAATRTSDSAHQQIYFDLQNSTGSQVGRWFNV